MIPVIVNATAGAGHAENDFEGLRQLFRDAGADARILPARNGDEIRDLARAAMKDSPPVLVAAGGDGTVSSVAEFTRGTSTALGILPLGTLNHLARDLGLPFDLAAAVAVAVGGRRVAIDVGEVNGIAFLNNSSIGLYPDIVRDRSRQQRRLGRSKRAAMLWAILAAMRRSPLLRIRLLLDQREEDFCAPFVFVGNNQYQMEGFQIGQRAKLEGGELSVYTTRRSEPIDLLVLAFRALFRRLRQAEDFSATTARQLTVAMRRKRVTVAIDGEVRVMDTPLEYRIVPRSLLVMAPLASQPP